MRLLHTAAKTRVAFNDPNLVSHAGLIPAMRLARNIGLEDLVGEHVKVAAKVGANPGVKVGSLVAGHRARPDPSTGHARLGPPRRDPRRHPAYRTHPDHRPSRPQRTRPDHLAPTRNMALARRLAGRLRRHPPRTPTPAAGETPRALTPHPLDHPSGAHHRPQRTGWRRDQQLPPAPDTAPPTPRSTTYPETIIQIRAVDSGSARQGHGGHGRSAVMFPTQQRHHR